MAQVFRCGERPVSRLEARVRSARRGPDLSPKEVGAVPAVVIDKDDQYVLNHCTRFLARDVDERRHDFGQYAPDDPRAAVCEAWRYPVIDSYYDGESADASYPFNAVTFVYDGRTAAADDVAVTGTFTELYDAAPLRPVSFLGEPTGIHALTVRVPKGQVHTYRLRVDGRWQVDPLNPQTVELDNGRQWSRFFTEGCQIPVSFTRRERELLGRLVSHLLPFRLPENEQFIRGVYESLDRQSRASQFPLAYKLDEEVGVVNYIDKVVARAERHHLDDYRTCLEIVDDLLKARHPGRDPLTLPRDAFADLYDEMATDSVAGWDTARYGSPRFFLLLLRRHAMTGAFVHPRHGGNSGTAGWAYLQDRYPFDWQAAIEAPLGRNTDYHG